MEFNKKTNDNNKVTVENINKYIDEKFGIQEKIDKNHFNNDKKAKKDNKNDKK